MRRSASSSEAFNDCNPRLKPTDNESDPAYEPPEPACQDVGIQIYTPQENAQDASEYFHL